MNEKEYLAEYAPYLTRNLGKTNISQNLFQIPQGFSCISITGNDFMSQTLRLKTCLE